MLENEMNIDVSIVVPVYNTDTEQIERCIKSIFSQNLEKFEIVIVDDGSNNDVALFLDDKYSKIDHIRIIHKQNAGLAMARNTGIDIARGQYIYFLDSDDVIPGRGLKILLDSAKQNDSDINVGLMIRITNEDVEKKIDSYNSENYNSFDISSDDVFRDYINHLFGCKDDRFIFENGYIGPSACNKLCKTTLLKKVKFEAGTYWDEDNIWNLRITKECKKISIINLVTYLYTVTDGSITRGFRKNCPTEFKSLLALETEIIKKLWPDCIKGMNVWGWRQIYTLCRTYLFHPLNSNSFFQNYEIFKDAVSYDIYRDVLRNVEFSETGMSRLAKKIITFFELKKLYLFPYFFWKWRVNKTKSSW